MIDRKVYRLPDSRLPKYAQIKEVIRQKILSNEWTDGCRIPIEAEFCTMFDVSRITVRKALEELQAEGYLVKIQGKGTYVRSQVLEQHLSKFYSFSEELRKRGLLEEAEIIEMTVIGANAKLAANLEIGVSEPVLRIIRLRRTENGPYAIETSYIPQRYVENITRKMIDDHGLYHTMRELGVEVNTARETFRAFNINKEQSQLLDLRIDAAAMELTRVAYSGATVVEYCVSVVRGDFFSYTVELT